MKLSNLTENKLILPKKITKNKSKQLRVENELKKLKTFDSSSFIGKSHFEEDGTQNNLVFQPINKYFKVITNAKYISSYKSKGLSDETIKPPATSDNSLSPLIDYHGNKIRLKFNGDCLKQPKLSYTHRKTVKIYIVYELGACSSHSNDPPLENSLFGAVSTIIYVMELHLIENQVFHFQVVDLVKFFGQI